MGLARVLYTGLYTQGAQAWGWDVVSGQSLCPPLSGVISVLFCRRQEDGQDMT